jgi:sugar lactone lactonase YvrE
VSSVSVTCAPYAAYVTTVAGSAYGTTDGTGATASFADPAGMAADASGNFYSADNGSGLLRKITPGGVVTTVASGLNGPWGVAVGPDGNFYVASLGLHTILKVTPAGAVTTFAGTSGVPGGADGNGTSASFDLPAGVAFDHAGNLYVSELAGRIRKITPAGDVSTLVPAGSGLGPVYTLAVDDGGVVYVPDIDNSKVWQVQPDGSLGTFAGSGTQGSADGPAASAEFNGPIGIALGRDGAVYVSDIWGNELRRIANGTVTTIAGTTTSGNADGPATTGATLYGPMGMAFAADGTLYFSDYFGSLIRKLGRQ